MARGIIDDAAVAAFNADGYVLIRGMLDAEETALGWVPGPTSINLDGLSDFSPERLAQAQAIYDEEWRREILMQDELFIKLHARLPKELIFQRELLLARL